MASSIFAPFRTRLVILMLLAVLPAFGLVVYEYREQRRLETERVREGAIAVARLAAATQENFTKNTRQMLATLTQFPFLLLGTNRAYCETHLSNLRKLSPDYLNFGLVETNGNVFCSAQPFDGMVNVSDRSYFQQVMQTNKFSTGVYQIGRLTGQPALNFGYPVLNEKGMLQRIVYASLKLSPLTDALARIPDAKDFVGKSLAQDAVFKRILDRKEQIFEIAETNGITRLHVVSLVD